MNTHYKTAWGYIRRSPFQSMAVIFVLTLTFFVATIVSVLVYSSSKTLTYFETRPQIIAFLKSDVSDSDVADLQHRLEANPEINSVKYVSKEEALLIYQDATSDNPLLGQLVSPSIFPASLEFSVKDLAYAQSAVDMVKAESIVDSVGFTAAIGGEDSLNDVIERIKALTNYVRVGGIIFAGLLAISSLVVLLVITGMRVVGRRDEVEILNLIGATKGFIRSPLVIEAAIYSITGVVLGWAIAFIAILYLSPSIIAYFEGIPILPKDATGLFKLFGVILGIELFVGAILALTGSLLTVSRVKKVR